ALWLERLAHGTDESRRRLESAALVLWPLVPQLLQALPGDALLSRAGIFPDASELADAVLGRVTDAARRVGLTLPPLTPPSSPDLRVERPDGHLAALLAEMQSVARADPAAESW